MFRPRASRTRSCRKSPSILTGLLIVLTLLLPLHAWSQVGVVAVWADSLVEIPDGWALNAAYTDMFIRGTNTGVEPGQMGGTSIHSHPINLDGCSTGPTADQTVAHLGAGFVQTFWQHSHSVDFGITSTTYEGGLPAHARLAYVVSDTLDLAPPGLIAMWSLPHATIPAGWFQCDGSAGRPDLSDRFVRGTGVEEEPGTQVADSSWHTHMVSQLTAYSDAAVNPTPFASTCLVDCVTVPGSEHNHLTTMSGGACEYASADAPSYHELVFIRCESAMPTPPPPGLIVMWSGPIAGIPTGWHLCDGSEGTPDLRGRFIRGTEPQENPGSTGGGGEHRHTYQGSISTAQTMATVDVVPFDSGTYPDGGSHTHSGQCVRDSYYNAPVPPFVELAFIMNLNPTGVADYTGDNPQARPRLHSVYPNPFNPQTTIVFDLPTGSAVDLGVFNVAGRRVRSLVSSVRYGPGRHEVIWDGRDDSGDQVASGTYFCRFDVGGVSETEELTLLK